jgi:ATP-dependent Clp protease ATP-binding subunit ClpB
VDFKNTVIIMTSNIGSQWISELGGGNDEEMRRRIMETLRQQFRPEFLNRVDEIIIFQSLTRAQLGSIVEIQLRHLRSLLADRGLDLAFSERAREALADEGFDPIYGARPLRRTIQRRIQDPLALQLLGGTYKAGDTVFVDYDGDGYVFERRETAEPTTRN